jgi:ArsR family transcriptional regulator, arsenate/arsenite/antimonite-responsive transcriptional repressor
MPASRADLGPVLDLSRCCEPLTSQVPDEHESERLAAAFRALGDPVRLRLLGILLTAHGGEVCACDLVGPVARSQPTVSHHLRVLREAGLVTATRRGTNIWYAPKAAQLSALRQILDPSADGGAADR